MSYIVSNCPSCIISPSCCAKYHIDNGHAKDCQDIEDCVIKRVIDLCNNDISPNEANLYKAGRMSLAVNIIGLFDIEEINK